MTSEMSLGFMVRPFLLCVVFTARMLLWSSAIKLNSALCVRPQRNDSLIFILEIIVLFLMPRICLLLFTSSHGNVHISCFVLVAKNV